VQDIKDLNAEELEQLTDWHPLMEPAIRYLAQHKVGLQPARDQLRFIMREAILTVDQELHKQRDQRRENAREMGENARRARENL
jgi:hypothetical protein